MLAIKYDLKTSSAKKHTGSGANTIGLASPTTATHLLQAGHIAKAAGSIILEVLARIERIGAAYLAVDAVVVLVGDAVSIVDLALAVGPVGAGAAGEDGLAVHAGAGCGSVLKMRPRLSG